jgi:hypothetical protein
MSFAVGAQSGVKTSFSLFSGLLELHRRRRHFRCHTDPHICHEPLGFVRNVQVSVIRLELVIQCNIS